jgi:hypothetical protein
MPKSWLTRLSRSKGLFDMDMSGNAPTLEQRLQALEAMEAIRALKARYASLADQKYTPDYQRQPEARIKELASMQAACFTHDAVWHGGSSFGADLVGQQQLTKWFTQSPWCFAVHYYVSPQITVDGDHASATWRLWQVALRADTHEAVLLAAITSEQYRKQHDGGWLHSRMQFDQIHMLPMAAGQFPLQSTFATRPGDTGPEGISRKQT